MIHRTHANVEQVIQVRFVHKQQILVRYHHVKMVAHALIQSMVIVVNVRNIIKVVIVAYQSIHVRVIHALHRARFHVKLMRIQRIIIIVVHVNQDIRVK